MHAEIKAFEGLWPGGYWEGDPADPHTVSSYSAIDMNEGYASQAAVRAEKRICAEELGFLSTLHVVYLMCIRNRVRDKVVLEIGPGRGAWSKAILESGAARLFALDALSAEHNQFFPYVDPRGVHGDKISYRQVSDFNATLPEGAQVDFVFSFGCFCHIRRPGVSEYMRNVRDRMKVGAEGFIMISDYVKMFAAAGGVFDPDNFVEGGNGAGVPWSHLGTDWFCDLLGDVGLTVLDPDIGCNRRDPIVHFRR